MERKFIKRSDRGLTFSFAGSNNFKVGKMYKYVVDIKSNKIFIVPTKDKERALRVSKKKTTHNIKALIDLRSKMVKAVVSNAEYLEVVIKDNIITVEGLIKDNNTLKSKGKIKIKLSLLNGKAASDINNVFKVVSIFSGSGMLDLPFSKDKTFEIVKAVEYDKDACMSYKANIGDIVVNRDIRNIDVEDLPNAEVLIGGPVCCSFSNANRVKRLEEHDGSNLLLEYLRIAKMGEYQVFVMENVPTLLSVNNSHYYEIIKEQLCDYDITPVILRDNEVGGYTLRKRLFIIGSKIGKPCINYVKKAAKTVGQALSKVHEGWKNYNDYTVHSSRTVEKMSFIPQGGNWENVPKEYRSEKWNKGKTHSNTYRRLKLDEPAVTLANFRKCVLIHPTLNRCITVAEASAISGFDEDFQYLGKLSSRQLQVANGVCKKMAETIKDIVKSLLLKNNLN